MSEHPLLLEGYHPDSDTALASAFLITGSDNQCESPRHRHRKGQLILAIHGGGNL